MRKPHESLTDFSPYNVDETVLDRLVRDPMQVVRTSVELGRSALKGALSMVTSATIGMAPVTAIPFPNVSTNENLRAASIAVLEDGKELPTCPEGSPLAILQIAGVGMTTVSDYAASVTEKILGAQFDECNAALRNGEVGYTATYYAELLHEFIEANQLKDVIIFAHSFGGITAVDILNIYFRLYPDSKVDFAIIFFSSPAGPQDLRAISWLGAEFHKHTPPSKILVKGETYGGMVSQGGINPFSEQTRIDANNNAAATPPILTKEQTTRLMEGMYELTPEARVHIKLFEFVGDEKDSVIRNEQAPWSIEEASGKPIDKIRHVNYQDNTMSHHAGLWVDKYLEVNRYAVAGSVEDAVNKFGITGRKPIKNYSHGTPSGLYRRE